MAYYHWHKVILADMGVVGLEPGYVEIYVVSCSAQIPAGVGEQLAILVWMMSSGQ